MDPTSSWKRCLGTKLVWSLINQQCAREGEGWGWQEDGSDPWRTAEGRMGSSSCLQFQIDQQVPDCLLSSSVRLLFRLNVNNIQETCQKNAASALAVGRRDLVQVLC